MASRKPLVPRNREIGRETGKPAKKERYRFALLSKAPLVEQVNMILGQLDASMPRISITEEDLTNPTVSIYTNLQVKILLWEVIHA